MSVRTRHNFRDRNEPDLVTFARQLGGDWEQAGPLDGWIWIPRRVSWFPVEIKDPAREGLKHEYTPKQKRFMRRCTERSIPVLTWRTDADVLRDLGGRKAA